MSETAQRQVVTYLVGALILAAVAQGLLAWRSMATMQKDIESIKMDQEADAKFWKIHAQTRAAINADRVRHNQAHPEHQIMLFDWDLSE